MSSNLSEKAKGKQRAVEALDNAPATPPSKDLTIRFTEGVPDLTLQVAEKDTVKEVKAKVCTRLALRLALWHVIQVCRNVVRRSVWRGRSWRTDVSG